MSDKIERRSSSASVSSLDIEKADTSAHDGLASLPKSGSMAPSSAPLRFGLPERRDSVEQKRIRRERTLERTHSIGSLSGPARVDAGPRVVGEFRTLSISLSQGGLADPTDAKGRKTAQQKDVQAKALEAIAALEWHSITAEEACQRLNTNATSGLEGEQVTRRQSENGPNRLSKPSRNLVKKLVSYVFGGFGTLLLVAAIICMLAWKPLGEPAPQVSNLALSVVLFVVIAINGVFNAWQDWSTSRTMEAIGGMLPTEVEIVRDGQHLSVPAVELTLGDLVVLTMGIKAAADLRVVSIDSELKFERSALTGESEAVPCSLEAEKGNPLEATNVVFAGTSCVSGSGLGIVTSIGDNTVFGRLAKLSSAPRKGMTTLEREVFWLVVTITSIAVTVALIALIIWLAYLHPKHPNFMNVPSLLVNLVSILVAFIPEGLPPSITISLTAVAARMRQSRCLAKNLAVVETLGSVNVICSDKTGTLTQNKMFVRCCGVHGLDSTPSDAVKHVAVGGPVGSTLQQLQFVAAICNEAVFDHATITLPLHERKIFGQATDTAILRFAEEVSSVNDSRQGWRTEAQLAFNSKFKFSMAALRCEDKSKMASALGSAQPFSADDDYLILTKGAPDVLMPRCTSVLDVTGDILPLTVERRAELARMQLSWATQGQRVLLFARRIVPQTSLDPQRISEEHWIDLEQNLTIVGLVGIVDPPRPEIPQVVKTCRDAGSRFFMVTGDHAATAVAIARQCGIVTSEKVLSYEDLDGLDLPPFHFQDDNASRPQRAVSITGDDLRRMTPEQWETLTRFDEIVFSRVVPEQKVRVVTSFQEREGVVAMTGDGVNDAPALKKADVGIAMGSGSAVAIESADLVLLDTFSSIVDALLYGRLCFENLRKTIAYLLPAGSFAELWAVLVAFLFGLPQPLSNIQMILVCVATDLVSALSLIFEQPEADLLTRKPRNTKKDRMADWRLFLQSYVFVGVPTAVACQAMCYWYMQRKGVAFSDIFLTYGSGKFQTANPELFNEILYRGQSCFFACQVFMQWFNLLSLRTRRQSLFQQLPLGNKRTRNVWILPAMLAALGFFVFFSYVPPIQDAFLTRGVDAEYWFLPMAFGAAMLAIDEARKYCVRTYPKGFLARIAW